MLREELARRFEIGSHPLSFRGAEAAGAGVRRVSFEQVPDLSDSAAAMTLSGGRLVAAGPVTVDPETSFGITRTTSSLIFRDGLERGSTGGWSGN